MKKISDIITAAKNDPPPSRRGRGLKAFHGRQTLLKAERQARVVQLFRELVAAGCTGVQQEIAHRLGVNPQQVGLDLDELWPRWRAQAMNEVQAIVESVLAECDWVKAEARAAWQASKGTQKTVQEERTRTGGRGLALMKTVTTLRDQTGDARYLSQILAAEDVRIRLTVGYKPLKTESMTVDLSQLDDEQLSRLERGEPLASVLRAEQQAAPTVG